MKYSVEFSPSARDELNAIDDYIFVEFGVSAQRNFTKGSLSPWHTYQAFPIPILNQKSKRTKKGLGNVIYEP